MLQAVADTHAVIWYLYDDRRLSAAARATFEEAVRAGLPLISRDRQITLSGLPIIW